MSGVNDSILAVTEALGRITKNVDVAGIGGGRDYKVVGIDQIIERIQPLLVEHGLSIVPYVSEAKSWDTDTVDSTGTVVGSRHWAQVFVDYTITDKAGNSITARMVGESENNNDKSLSAALSMAEKYFYKQTFKIVTGDPDPDTVGTKVIAIEGEKPAPRQQQSPASRPQPAPQQQQMKETIAANAQGGTGDSSKSQQQMIWAITHKTLNQDDVWMFDFIENKTGARIESLTELSSQQARKVIDALKPLEKKAKGE